MIQAGLAALAAIAGLAGKAAQDKARKEQEERERQQFKASHVNSILARRADMGGADTTRSGLAAEEQQFLRQQAANRPDTSGDFLPFVNALSGVAQGVAGDLAKAPSAVANAVSTAVKPQQSLAPISNVIDQYGDPDDPEKRSFLMKLAQRNGWQ